MGRFCVALDKSLNLLSLRFPHLEYGIIRTCPAFQKVSVMIR